MLLNNSNKAYAENQTGHKIKALRDDKGGEYMSNAFLRFTDECGTIRQQFEIGLSRMV